MADKFLDPGSYLIGAGDYLQRKRVYELFDILVKECIARRPSDPVEFFIDLIPRIPVSQYGSYAPIPRVLALGADEDETVDFVKKRNPEGDDLKIISGKGKSCDTIIEELLQTERWVCCNFPRTITEAQALVDNNILLSDIVIIDTAALVLEFQHSRETILQKEGTFRRDVVPAVLATFPKSLIRTVQKYETFELIRPPKPLVTKPITKPKILLHGPRGSGCTLQGGRLAAEFGLVFIDAHRLGAGSARLEEVLLLKRLSQEDVRDRGFLITHYPKSKSEAESLKRHIDKAMPGETHVLHLACSKSVALSRIAGKQYKDRGTGAFMSEAEAQKSARAFRSRADTEAEFDKAWCLYEEQLPGIKEAIPSFHSVDANQLAPRHVFEQGVEIISRLL